MCVLQCTRPTVWPHALYGPRLLVFSWMCTTIPDGRLKEKPRHAHLPMPSCWGHVHPPWITLFGTFHGKGVTWHVPWMSASSTPCSASRLHLCLAHPFLWPEWRSVVRVGPILFTRVHAAARLGHSAFRRLWTLTHKPVDGFPVLSG